VKSARLSLRAPDLPSGMRHWNSCPQMRAFAAMSAHRSGQRLGIAGRAGNVRSGRCGPGDATPSTSMDRGPAVLPITRETPLNASWCKMPNQWMHRPGICCKTVFHSGDSAVRKDVQGCETSG
jgi:hypothetical protein